MRKRNVHIQFWLDKKETEAFQKKVKKSGLSREAYLRHLVNGLEPQDAPPPDYYAMMRELHGIGNNLNQIARSLNEYGTPYNALSVEVRAAISDLAALKFEVLRKVGDAVGNIQTYQL